MSRRRHYAPFSLLRFCCFVRRQRLNGSSRLDHSILKLDIKADGRYTGHQCSNTLFSHGRSGIQVRQRCWWRNAPQRLRVFEDSLIYKHAFNPFY